MNITPNMNTHSGIRLETILKYIYQESYEYILKLDSLFTTSELM